jgi:ABC-type dipeptide/oligopeptide/nickel transport system ATPase subunit/GNAT superfamily N-acetyltransferase
MKIDVAVETEIKQTLRVEQLSAMFDAPVGDKCRLEWKIDFPIEEQPWNVGLVVGPSGSGKSTIMRSVWGEPPELSWTAGSVVDDFKKGIPIGDIAAACQAVGFNTIPAWMRPQSVLSNGEKFRVDLARRLLELPDPIVVDEFTSVVDRQVAQIGCHAVQKHVRRSKRQFVGVSCHYDIIDWLQPDWVLDMATRTFTRRLLRQRPSVDVVVGRVPYAAWELFAPFHYLTAELNKAARCFGLWAGGRLAAFAGVLYRPHPRVGDIYGLSRVVTLPDWQGLGLAFVMVDQIAAAYKALGKRFHTYPAHPSLVRSFDASPKWKLESKPGTLRATTRASASSDIAGKGFGGRPNAVFSWAGEALPESEARAILGDAVKG